MQSSEITEILSWSSNCVPLPTTFSLPTVRLSQTCTPPLHLPTRWLTIEVITDVKGDRVMAEAVIVEAVRSPIGKRNGGLSGVHPADLSAQVLNGLVTKAGIDPEIVDDVIWGCVMQAGEQSLDIARTALLAAGWPESVPGVTVDRQCGSSP